MNYIYYGFGLKLNSNIQLMGLSENKNDVEYKILEVSLSVIVDPQYSSKKSTYMMYANGG